jgi:hypothetical protein
LENRITNLHSKINFASLVIAALVVSITSLSLGLEMETVQNNYIVLWTAFAKGKLESTHNPDISIGTLLNTTMVSKSYRVAFNGATSSVRDPLSNHEQQSVTVLPLVNESMIYSGTITFTANKPVDLQVAHLYSNKTYGNESRPIPESTTKLYKSPNIGISTIMPAYPLQSLQYSASVSFAGNSLSLHSNTQAFNAIFSVAADIDKIYDNQSRISTTSASKANLDQQKVEPLQPVTSYTLPTTNLVAQLLLESSPELVAQIPLDHLAQKDIVQVFKNIPKEKVGIIMKGMPQERVAAILSKLPEKDRNEIKNMINQSGR